MVVSVEFGIKNRLLVSGDAVKTAGNVLANQTLFRINIVGDLVYAAGVILIACGLYVILKSVSETLAMVAMIFRLIFAAMWLLVTYNMSVAIRLLKPGAYLKAFGTAQLQALARFDLSGYYEYYIGLVFWSVAAAICGWLLLKSRYVPGWLAIFGIAGSIWCAACTIGLIVYPDLPNYVNLWWFDVPMTLYEVVLAFLLLFRGLRA